MSSTILDSLVELNDVLTQLGELRERHDQVPESMRELHEEHGQVTADIERLEAELLEAEQARRAAEAAADDEQEKIEHFQKQISLVTTQREHGALLSEIDTARNHKQEQEDAGLLAIEQHEEATQQKQELEERFSELDSGYRGQLGEWESEKPDIARQIKQLEARAAVLREQLSPPILSKFELLYERHDGKPLARIDKIERTGKNPAMYRCSVCNYSVRPQVVVEIQTRGDLVTCDCGRQRIFYLDLETTG